jgi:hypothetical protein
MILYNVMIQLKITSSRASMRIYYKCNPNKYFHNITGVSINFELQK